MSGLIRKYYLTIVFFGIISLIQAQINSCDLAVKDVSSIDSNRITFKGKTANFSDSVKLAIEISLNYFPELMNSKITFRSKKIKTTMNARPTLGSMLYRKTSYYRYIVRINSCEMDSIIQIKHIPFEALVGVFGHEFCHFVDYGQHKKSHLLKRAFDYGSKKRKAEFEKEIDRMAISRGLGCHLYKWSYYVLFESNAKAAYKLFKRSTYLQPHEILELMPQ